MSTTYWCMGASLAPYVKCVCVCESYIGKPIGTRAVPQFTTMGRVMLWCRYTVFSFLSCPWEVLMDTDYSVGSFVVKNYLVVQAR